MIKLLPTTSQQAIDILPREYTINSDLVVNGDFSQEGSELITNGDFATDSDWTKGTNCTIENGKAKYTNSPSGQGFTQSNFLTIGKNYKVTFTVSDFSLGSVKIRFPFNSTNTITSNGTYTEYGVATVDDLYFQNVGNTTLSIDNVNVKEVGQNWTTQGDVSIGGGVATYTETDELSQIIQSNVMVVGKQYRWTYEVKSKTSGTLRTSLFGSTSQNVDIPSEIGFNTIQGVAFQTDLKIKRGSDPTNLTLTNISVRESTSLEFITLVIIEDGTRKSQTITSVPYTTNGNFLRLYCDFTILTEGNSYHFEVKQGTTLLYRDKIYCTSQTSKTVSHTLNTNKYTEVVGSDSTVPKYIVV